MINKNKKIKKNNRKLRHARVMTILCTIYKIGFGFHHDTIFFPVNQNKVNVNKLDSNIRLVILRNGISIYPCTFLMKYRVFHKI